MRLPVLWILSAAQTVTRCATRRLAGCRQRDLRQAKERGARWSDVMEPDTACALRRLLSAEWPASYALGEFNGGDDR